MIDVPLHVGERFTAFRNDAVIQYKGNVFAFVSYTSLRE